MAEPRKPERKGPSNPYVTGPTKKLEVTQPVTAGRRGPAETTRPVGRPDLVTEGMKAHRREIERRKRQAAIEKLHKEQGAADTRRSFWKWAAIVVVTFVVALAYRMLQDSYGNRWPIWDVWLLLGAALFGSIGWLLWYLNRKEL